MGEWEGKTYDSLLQDQRWKIWCDNWLTARPPGGESLFDLQKRVQDWLANTSLTPHTLLVSHAGVVRTLYRQAGWPWTTAMKEPVPHLTWKKILIESQNI